MIYRTNYYSLRNSNIYNVTDWENFEEIEKWGEINDYKIIKIKKEKIILINEKEVIIYSK